MRRLLAVGLAALALAMASAGDAAQNFFDRRGDAHGAPDISTLYLQDRWGGKPDFLYFGFGISDLPGKLLVDFDTDKNAATGGPSGSDYRVEVAVRTGGARLLRWSGNRFSPVASPTLRGYGPGPEFSLSRIDLGGTRAFRFWLTTTNGRARDRAPDVGTWTFSLVKADAGAGPFLLSDPEPDPKGVHAGKAFSLAAEVNRSIPTPKIACSGRVGSRYLTMKGSYAARTVTCSGVMPRGTAGGRFIGTIEASAGGYRSSASFLISVDP